MSRIDAAAPHPRPRPHAARRLTRLTLLAVSSSLLLSGCIRRYAAPTEPEEAHTPYSAFAALHRVSLPPGPGGAALPLAALRLAISPTGWMADSVLVDGEAGRIEEGEGDAGPALTLLEDRSEPVVVLLDRSLLGHPAHCELLALLGERAVLATGTSAYGRGAASQRSEPGVSRDPLGGVSAAHACDGSLLP